MSRSSSKKRPGVQEAAFRALARRDHFVGELRLKLRHRGYEVSEIEEAITACLEHGYLDEARVARRFVRQQSVHRGWGPLRLIAEMKRRGVDEALAEATVAERPDLVRQALELSLERLERREARGWWALHARKGRMVSSLLNRGFEAEEAASAVLELAAQREREHHAFDEQP